MFGARSFEEETRDMVDELPRGFLLVDASGTVLFQDSESRRREETEYTTQHLEAAKHQGLIEVDILSSASHLKKSLCYKPALGTQKYNDWKA
jgi:hypothetical protein